MYKKKSYMPVEVRRQIVSNFFNGSCKEGSECIKCSPQQVRYCYNVKMARIKKEQKKENENINQKEDNPVLTENRIKVLENKIAELQEEKAKKEVDSRKTEEQIKKLEEKIEKLIEAKENKNVPEKPSETLPEKLLETLPEKKEPEKEELEKLSEIQAEKGKLEKLPETPAEKEELPKEAKPKVTMVVETKNKKKLILSCIIDTIQEEEEGK